MENAGMTRRELLEFLAAIPAGVAATAATANTANAKETAEPALYRDARNPIDLRVTDLLSRMTLEEKVAQMIALWATKEDVMDDLEFSPALASEMYPNGFGQITRPSDKRGGTGIPDAAGGVAARWRTPEDTVNFINAVQKWAVEETRLGIPVLFHAESLHGYMATEATMFPQAIALAGTFDTDLMRDVSSVIAREVRARGVPFVLSPVVDIARDSRWGRIEETFGESPRAMRLSICERATCGRTGTRMLTTSTSAWRSWRGSASAASPTTWCMRQVIGRRSQIRQRPLPSSRKGQA